MVRIRPGRCVQRLPQNVNRCLLSYSSTLSSCVGVRSVSLHLLLPSDGEPRPIPFPVGGELRVIPSILHATERCPHVPGKMNSDTPQTGAWVADNPPSPPVRRCHSLPGERAPDWPSTQVTLGPGWVRIHWSRTSAPAHFDSGRVESCRVSVPRRCGQMSSRGSSCTPPPCNCTFSCAIDPGANCTPHCCEPGHTRGHCHTSVHH